MRDFPVFTTEHGAASLVLREIPYKSIAYITLQDTLQPEALLQECVDFCRVAGARKIYATGHKILEQYPLHTAMWKMRRLRCNMPVIDAVPIPITEQNVEFWRSLHNQKMADIPNAATMTVADSKQLLTRGAGYFIYREKELLGIGVAAGDTVESVIACKRGAGADVLLALCTCLTSDHIYLGVASANMPARKLYDRLGFIKTEELSRWYTVENNP